MKNRDEVVKRVGILGILINFVLLCIKLLVGLFSRSQAMIADSINSAGDIFASVMSFIGAKVSSKPKDEDHPYGHGKAEYIFSELISISIILAAIVMIKNSIQSIILNEKLEFSSWLVAVCIVTIVTKFILYIYTRMQYKKYNSILIKTSMEDHRNDIFVTFSTLIGIIFSLFDIYFIDGIVGCLISLWFGYVGFKLFFESYKVLIDTTLDKEAQIQISSMIGNYPEILHVDSIATKPVGNRHVIILKISMDGKKTLEECHKTSGKLKDDIIKKFEYVYDVVIHINPH